MLTARLWFLLPLEAEPCPPDSPLLTLGVPRPVHTASRMPQSSLGLAQVLGQLAACLSSVDGLGGSAKNHSRLWGRVKEQTS